MRRLLARRGVHVVLLLTVLLSALFLSGTNNAFITRLQYATFDTFNKLAPRGANAYTVIVDIDEDSVARLGQWPWPRDVMASLVTQLKSMGAKATVFDIVFAESDRTSPVQLAARLPQSARDVKAMLTGMPDTDMQFADAIKQTGQVVTGFVWAEQGNKGKVPYVTSGMVISKGAQALLMREATVANAMLTNLPAFEKAAAGNGSFSVSTDLDGIVRRVPLIIRFGDTLYPSLALEALRVALGGQASIQVRETPQRIWQDSLKPALMVRVGNITLPMDSDGQIWVYYSPSVKKTYVPAADVIEGRVPLEEVKNKIAVIGTSAEGLKDIRSSPLDLFVPGVEMHTNIIEQAMQGQFIYRPAFAKGVEALFIFVTSMAVIVLTPFIPLFWLLGVVVLLGAGAFALSWQAYTTLGVMVDPVFPTLSVLAIFMLAALLAYLKSELERRDIQGAFGLYISPAYMKELTESPDKLKLGGEIRTLTIMFTDIRNFTKISEGMAPEVLINTMNDFLTPMSDEVMKARGTIDKFMGDAMMAFWNAPLDVDAHEIHACRAALAMQGVLDPVNAKLKAQAEAAGRTHIPLQCGIGLNTGPVAVGNMGSRQRFAYSVLGDAVNMASRLEGQTKTYGVQILLGEATAQAASNFACVELDSIRVVGKDQPARIYTLLGDEAVADTDAFKDFMADHTAFLAAYRTGAWDDAISACNRARAHAVAQPLLGYYKLLEARVAAFKKTPPQNWDGVFNALEK